MPWEYVGGCGGGQLPEDKDWIVFCYRMAIDYLDFVLEEPPDGCELGIMWHEHELGEYPSVGVHWDFPQSEPPWSYIRKVEIALSRFNRAIEWFDISPREIESAFEDSNWSEADEET